MKDLGKVQQIGQLALAPRQARQPCPHPPLEHQRVEHVHESMGIPLRVERSEPLAVALQGFGVFGGPVQLARVAAQRSRAQRPLDQRLIVGPGRCLKDIPHFACFVGVEEIPGPAQYGRHPHPPERFLAVPRFVPALYQHGNITGLQRPGAQHGLALASQVQQVRDTSGNQ